jgi:hypothetical protein
MAKISGEERDSYSRKIQPFQSSIEKYLERETSALKAIEMEDSPPAAASLRFYLAEDMLNLASNYIVINALSVSLLKLKNENALHEGQRFLYKSLGYLEEITGKAVDAPFSDYEERLAAIADLDAEKRYRMIRKMGLAIRLLENAYGDHAKWKWALVDLEGHFAALAKNILDLKAAYANTDPRSPWYEPTLRHLRLAEKLLAAAADRYRNRYELSTSHIEDFKRGIEFLSALRRLYAFMGQRDKAELLRKQMEAWSAKLEGDRKQGKAITPKNT